MRCPLLREEQVKSCRAVPFRRAFARSALKGTDERCSSLEHVHCAALYESREAHPEISRCPFLQESLVQFCSAAPRPTYVPWSESPELRCGHDGHRYCELYLAISGGPAPSAAPASATQVVDVGGIAMPAWLSYTPSHLWLDVGDDGLLHVGADAFVTRVVGTVEQLAFLTAKGHARPAVVLRVRGVDLTLAFPVPLQIVGANTHLRASLERLTADPYGLGWLFEARHADAQAATSLAAAGLRSGEAARRWMAGELVRAAEFVHERIVPRSPIGPLPADGGGLAPDLLQHLERDEILQLFAALFPQPLAGVRLP